MMPHIIKQYIPTALIIYVCLCTPHTLALHPKLSEKSRAQRERFSQKKRKLKDGLILLGVSFSACLIGYAAYTKGTDEDPNNTPSSNISPKPSPISGKVPSSNKTSFELPSASEQPVQNDDFPEKEIQQLQTEIAEIKQKGGLKNDLIDKKAKFKQLIESSKPWIYCDSTLKTARATGGSLNSQSTNNINSYLSGLTKENKENLNIVFTKNYKKLKDYPKTHDELKEQYDTFERFIQLIQESLFDNSSQVQSIGYKNLSFDEIITKFYNLYIQQHSNAKKYCYKNKTIYSSPNRQQMVSSWLYLTLINIYTKVDKMYKLENQERNIEEEISDKKAFWFSPDNNDSNTIEFNSNAQKLIKKVEIEILKELPNTLGEQYPASKEVITNLLSQQKSAWKKFITDSVKACFHIVSNQYPGLVIETNTKAHEKATYDEFDDDFDKNYNLVGNTEDGARFSYIVWPAIYSKKGTDTPTPKDVGFPIHLRLSIAQKRARPQASLGNMAHDAL